MNCCSCCSLLLNCFAKNDNFKNDSNESHNDVVVAHNNDDDDDKVLDQILRQNMSNIHVLSVDSWKQLLSARGDRLWSIRREMFSSSSSLPPSSTASTSPAAVSRPDPIVLAITSSPSTFQDLELKYGMDKQEPTRTMSPMSSSSSSSHKKAQPTSPCLPLTLCTGRHWETQRPKVQHGFRHIAERSQRCLILRENNKKYSCCCSSSSSSSSKSLVSIEDVIRREILSSSIDTVQGRQLVDLKVDVHGTVIRWIVRMFCRSNSLSLSAIEQNRLRKIEEVFDCYWKSIRLPQSPPDPSSSTTTKRKERPSFSRKNTKHNTAGSMMSVQEPYRLQLSQQLQEQLFYLQEMEGKNESSSNLHNQHHNADGDHDPSSPASSPLPLPILLELALSFEANPSDDDNNDMMTAVCGGGEHQSDVVVVVVDIVIANTVNAMIAAADACQSLVFWTLWNLGRRRQWWTDCRSEYNVSSSAVDTVDERTRHDLIELAALKQKATKGLKVRWYWSGNVGSAGVAGSSSPSPSSSGLSMLGCAIMETVRYFPPVWTLPRTINLRSDSNNSSSRNKKKKAKSSPIFVKLDVISINEAYDVRKWNPVIKYDKDAAAADDENENEEVAAHQDSEDGSGCYLASFGFGKRHCPAGTASLHAAYLISQHYLRRWEEIVDMDTENEVDDDDDGKEKSSSFPQSWSYLGPTLCVEDGRWFQVQYDSNERHRRSR